MFLLHIPVVHKHEGELFWGALHLAPELNRDRN